MPTLRSDFFAGPPDVPPAVGSLPEPPEQPNRPMTANNTSPNVFVKFKSSSQTGKLRSLCPGPPRHFPESPLITIQLTKLETALDQVRKSYPKLNPADAALIASGLTLAGRHALAVYDGSQYRWPEDNQKLMSAIVREIEQVQESAEPVKKTTKANAVEEEPITINVGLTPNVPAAESKLDGREDLKTKMSDILQDGVEYLYAGTDIGWQWALDRANWGTISGIELARKVKVKATFTEGAVGVEMGTTGTKKRATKSKTAAAPVAEAAEAVEASDDSDAVEA